MGPKKNRIRAWDSWYIIPVWTNLIVKKEARNEEGEGEEGARVPKQGWD